jgi:PKD repeat protein
MKKNFTPFERELKDKLEGHEMPYEHASWVALQRHMGMAKSGSSVWLVSLISTIIALSGGAIALYRHQHTPTFASKAQTNERFSKSVTTITKGVSHTNKNSSVTSGTLLFDSHKFDGQTANSFTNNSLSAVTEIYPDVNANATADQNSSGKPAELGLVSGNTIKADNLIEFACNVRKACQGEEVEFQTTNGPKSGSYLWNFGDGHFSDEINPKHKFSKAGNYDVSLSITSDNGQINTTVVNDMITIEEAPDADFSWEFINSDPSTPEVRIVNLTEGGNTYEWSNGAESKTISDGATFQLPKNGRHMIALNAKNQAGCTDGAVKHISINADFALNAPKQWSPSEGNFMPSGLKKSKIDFILYIYDSTGKEVFETSSRVKGWDGKLPDGTLAQSGSTFLYKVIITSDRSQEQKYFNGTFNVFP